MRGSSKKPKSLLDEGRPALQMSSKQLVLAISALLVMACVLFTLGIVVGRYDTSYREHDGTQIAQFSRDGALEQDEDGGPAAPKFQGTQLTPRQDVLEGKSRPGHPASQRTGRKPDIVPIPAPPPRSQTTAERGDTGRVAPAAPEGAGSSPDSKAPKAGGEAADGAAAAGGGGKEKAEPGRAGKAGSPDAGAPGPAPEDGAAEPAAGDGAGGKPAEKGAAGAESSGADSVGVLPHAAVGAHAAAGAHAGAGAEEGGEAPAGDTGKDAPGSEDGAKRGDSGGAAEPEAAAGKTYVVQVAALRGENRKQAAEELVKRLKTDFQAEAESLSVQDGKWIYVVAGRTTDAKAAQALRDRLRSEKKFADCFVKLL